MFQTRTPTKGDYFNTWTQYISATAAAAAAIQRNEHSPCECIVCRSFGAFTLIIFCLPERVRERERERVVFDIIWAWFILDFFIFHIFRYEDYFIHSDECNSPANAARFSQCSARTQSICWPVVGGKRLRWNGTIGWCVVNSYNNHIHRADLNKWINGSFHWVRPTNCR